MGSTSDARNNRKKLLSWALDNVVIGGYILTNKKLVVELQEAGVTNFQVIDLSKFDVPELWENVYETRLNTKIILKRIQNDKKESINYWN